MLEAGLRALHMLGTYSATELALDLFKISFSKKYMLYFLAGPNPI